MNRREISDTIGTIFLLLCAAFAVFMLACCAWLYIPGYEDDPYSEGMHWDYKIRCENGFIYKVRHREGAIQVLNSDGTPLRCGEKIY